MAMRPGAAQTRVNVSALLGLVAGVPAALLLPFADAALVAWAVACVAYMTWVWLTIWPLSPAETARHASFEDPSRATADVIMLTAAAASLLAVGFVLANAASRAGGDTREIGLGVASVGLSWAMLHTTFTLRYARTYHDGDDGGVDFNQTIPPRYSDFAYLAFTIGMTFQVSDTTLTTTEMRRDALRHAVLSFVFATGILATAVNLVASLTTR